MKKLLSLWVSLIVFVILVSACVPITFSPPTEIHLNSGDQVEQSVVAVDDEGRSHIAGVVNDRVVYYRTRYGEKLTAFEMTMTGSGTDWKQYNPDIAVLDSGRAFVTWVEQRGGPQKYACHQQIPVLVPIGGFDKDCDPLDGAQQAAGNVWVTASGTTAYAVYDRPAGNGRTADLWYQQLAGGSAIGRVDWFSLELKTAEIYSLDLGIDEGGFLHVGYHYNWTISGTPPFAERMELRSNRATQPDGQMSQVWLQLEGFLIEYTPVSLSFYHSGTTQRVAVAFGSYYQVWVDSCTAIGCGSRANDEVAWPVSWGLGSEVSDVEILGIGENLHVGFIGNSNSTPISTDQVYYTFDAFDVTAPEQISSGSATSKYDLQMTRVNARPESAADHFAVVAWGESSPTVNEFFIYDGILNTIKVYATNCVANLPSGEIGSNGFYVSGVWDDCGNTMFSTQAWTTQLPLIVK
jgi:hypothetical protein